MRGRLNLFQRAMLQWRELHPYSAVHAVRVPQPLDTAQLRSDIAAELEALGVTGLELDAKRGTFEFRGGPADVELELMEEGAGRAALEAHFEAQLNRPFVHAGARVQPFRFFACAAGSSYYLGIAYDHFIAGGDSIVMLMRRLVQRYQGAPERSRPELYPRTFRRLLLRYPAACVVSVARMSQFIAQCRRSYRPPLTGKTDCYNAYASFALKAEQVAALRATAAAFGITLNDLFLALALRALAPHAVGRLRSKRRRELAVASIMNIRREFQPEADDMFGQFLSSFRVSHPVPHSVNLRELGQDVHRQTEQIKSGKLYLQTLLALSLGRRVWPLLSVERRRAMFLKGCPVWAGVTALNADALWPPSATLAHPLEYVRAASTGPLAPLVFALTSFARAAHLGVIYRPAVFSGEMVNNIVGDLLDQTRTVAAVE
jgi:hypothetical protein